MNDACNGLSQTDDMGNSTPLNLGICQESCGYDEGMPMCSQGLSCVPQEITGGSVDPLFLYRLGIEIDVRFLPYPLPEAAQDA